MLVFNEITKMPTPYDPIAVGQRGEKKGHALCGGNGMGHRFVYVAVDGDFEELPLDRPISLRLIVFE